MENTIIINGKEYLKNVLVAEAMTRFGGNFIKCIGQALFHADQCNVRKIAETWPEEWDEYLEMAKKGLK